MFWFWVFFLPLHERLHVEAEAIMGKKKYGIWNLELHGSLQLSGLSVALLDLHFFSFGPDTAAESKVRPFAVVKT